MKIQLPNGQMSNLDESITIEEKLEIVNDLVKEFEDTISKNWNSNSVKFFLDTLGNYLVWHKEDDKKGLEDKEILSRKKMEKMVRYKKTSKSINFSDLSPLDKEKFLGESGSGETDA